MNELCYGRLGKYKSFGAAGGSGWKRGEVLLTWAATIVIDLHLGDLFVLQLTAVPCQILNPINIEGGQSFRLYLIQPVTANGTVTWDTAYRFGTELPMPGLTALASHADYLAFINNTYGGHVDYIGQVRDFI